MALHVVVVQWMLSSPQWKSSRGNRGAQTTRGVRLSSAFKRSTLRFSHSGNFSERLISGTTIIVSGNILEALATSFRIAGIVVEFTLFALSFIPTLIMM